MFVYYVQYNTFERPEKYRGPLKQFYYLAQYYCCCRRCLKLKKHKKIVFKEEEKTQQKLFTFVGSSVTSRASRRSQGIDIEQENKINTVSR